MQQAADSLVIDRALTALNSGGENVKLGILGTGDVAQTLAEASSKAGHDIVYGSRDPASKGLDFPVRGLAEALLYRSSSMGEKLQEALPAARVVKSMNTTRIMMVHRLGSSGRRRCSYPGTTPRRSPTWPAC